MRKVMVIGSGGAGKSTFAIRLGELLGIEVFHLDALYWNPGWVETPKQEWRNTLEELLRRDEWIIDGNYSNTFEARMAKCDTVIFLDIARPVCLWRLLKRWARYRGKNRPDMAEGCDEKLNWEFIIWVWDYKKKTRPRVIKLLTEASRDKRVVWLRSRAEVKKFLAVAGGAGKRRESIGR